MLSGHVMFTALVPYGSLSLPLFALRWIELISLALDTGQSESIGGDMRSKSGIIQNSRFSKIVFLISRVHHQCYSSVSPLRAQNASTTSFVSRSHWSQSSQANNQYCPFLFYNVATISVKNNHLQDLNTNSFDIECMSVFTVECERWCFNIAMNGKSTYNPSACLHLCLTRDLIKGHFWFHVLFVRHLPWDILMVASLWMFSAGGYYVQ